MCPPNHLLVLRTLDHNIRALLKKAVVRPDGFGMGMGPISIINGSVRQGLVIRDGFFRSGQPRWLLTLCGQRVGQYLFNRDNLFDPTQLDAIYDADACPLLNRSRSYHAYEEFEPNGLDSGYDDEEYEDDEQND